MGDGMRRGRPGCRPGLIWAVLVVVLAVEAMVASASGAQSLTWSAPSLIEPAPAVDRAQDLSAVSCARTGVCVAVDASGNVFSSRAPAAASASWRTTTLRSDEKAPVLTGASCTAPSLCVAIDRAGDVFSSLHPLTGAGAWNRVRVSRAGLVALACSSRRLCAAVGGAGRVLVSDDPSGPATGWHGARLGRSRLVAVACASIRLCTAASASGRVWATTDPTGRVVDWRESRLRDPGLTGLSCPSVQRCVAIDAHDEVHVTGDPGSPRSRWASVDLTELLRALPVGSEARVPLTAISCPSMRLCVVVDPAGEALTTSDPTGGTLAWRVSGVGDHGLVGLSCPSTRLCVAVNQASAFATSRPSAKRWIAAGIDADSVMGLSSVTCPSTTLCMAAATGGVRTPGEILYSTSPANTSARWKVAVTDPNAGPFGFDRGAIQAISCPTTSLCVAVDDGGSVFTTTDPSAGPSTWSPSAIDPGQPLNSVSCPSPEFCLVAGYGRVLASTNPTGGPTAWTQSSAPVDMVSCASPQMCAGTGNSGTYATSDPAVGYNAWNLVAFPGGAGPPGVPGPSLSAVSCPSARLCVGVGSAGLSDSTSPLVANSWTEVVNPHAVGLGTVSCNITQFYAITDSRGDVLTSAAPAQGSWTFTSIDPHSQIYGASCATAQFCVAVDARGRAIIAHPRSVNPQR
jgi:hypothetical protein